MIKVLKSILTWIVDLIIKIVRYFKSGFTWLRKRPLIYAMILTLLVLLIIWYSLNNENTRQCSETIKHNCDIGATSPVSFYSIYIFAIPIGIYALYLFYVSIKNAKN